jgi:hypothetical protein
MTAHRLVYAGARRPVNRNGLLQLGWLHFWLLSSILAGMLGLVVLVFLAYLSSR